MFRRLAESLADDGFRVLRFSFRGHGRSGGTQRGATIAEEMRHYHPLERFVRSRVPALVVHGGRDSAVSYDVARAAAQACGCDFHTIAGSDHGFDNRERENEAIAVTVSWLIRQHGG